MRLRNSDIVFNSHSSPQNRIQIPQSDNKFGVPLEHAAYATYGETGTKRKKKDCNMLAFFFYY